MTSNIIFTRYLYLKSGLLESLENSILKNDFQESLFWAYEIYFSGFEEEIFDFIFGIIERYYKNFPKLTVFLKKKRKEKNEETLGTILKNMCLRNHLSSERTGRQFYVIIDKKDVENQKTKNIGKQQLCLYDGLKREKDDSLINCLLNNLRYNWLFYASHSPIWKTRVLEYNGTIDNDKKTVTFSNDDDLENFYDKYGLEPDEQSILIQKRCIFT